MDTEAGGHKRDHPVEQALNGHHELRQGIVLAFSTNKYNSHNKYISNSHSPFIVLFFFFFFLVLRNFNLFMGFSKFSFTLF